MSWFPEYTIESAPAGSRRFMVATRDHLGYLPAATARWAASPHLLEAFGRMLAIFDNGTLDPVAREVVVMTIATRNGAPLTETITPSGSAERGAGYDRRTPGRTSRSACSRASISATPGPPPPKASAQARLNAW